MQYFLGQAVKGALGGARVIAGARLVQRHERCQRAELGCGLLRGQRRAVGGGQRVVVGQGLARGQGQSQGGSDQGRGFAGGQCLCGLRGCGLVNHRLHQGGQGVDGARAGWGLQGRGLGQSGVNVDAAHGDDGACRCGFWQQKGAFAAGKHARLQLTGIGQAVGVGVNVDLRAADVAVGHHTEREAACVIATHGLDDVLVVAAGVGVGVAQRQIPSAQGFIEGQGQRVAHDLDALDGLGHAIDADVKAAGKGAHVGHAGVVEAAVVA